MPLAGGGHTSRARLRWLQLSGLHARCQSQSAKWKESASHNCRSAPEQVVVGPAPASWMTASPPSSPSSSGSVKRTCVILNVLPRWRAENEALRPSGPVMDPHALPNTSAGGMALVAAMETVDRVVRSFTEDFGRAVAVVRAEVSRERDAALALVDSARAEVEQVRVCLHLALFPVRHKTQWRRTPFLTPSAYLPPSPA
jgi:hypothetical protein